MYISRGYPILWIINTFTVRFYHIVYFILGEKSASLI